MGETLGRIYLSVFPVLLDRMGLINTGRSWSRYLWPDPGALQWFLQPTTYFPSQSPGPFQSCCFPSSKFLFLLSLSLPAVSQPALVTYVMPIPLAHPTLFDARFPCSWILVHLQPFHQSQIRSMLPPGLFLQSHFLSGPFLFSCPKLLKL